jgi:hypothetical protein
VMPAKAGIQKHLMGWIPALACARRLRPE